MKLFRGRSKRHLMNGKKIFFFGVTDAAGCSLCWNESTHYVRAIAVFKISLTLRVIHLPCFWTDRDGGEAKRKEGKDWLVVIYKHCALWLPFPRLKHKTRLVPRCGLFFLFLFFCLFFTPAFSLSFFSYMCTQSKPASAPPLFSLTLWGTHKTYAHTPSACIHTPRLSLATGLPLQWDHCFKNKAVGFKSRNILQTLLYFPQRFSTQSARYFQL